MLFRLLLTAIFLTSCSTPNWYKPYGYMMFKKIPKKASPGFKLGWQHGCESGLGSQFGGGIFMYFYTWHRDVDITSSNPDVDKIRKRYKKELAGIDWNNRSQIDKNFNDYNSIFWNAHSFCHASVIGILQTTDISGDGGRGLIPTLPGDARYDPSQDSIGRVWSLHGKGDTRIGTGFW
ncbi:MAG: hypothetical protein KGP29_07345 [Proteobacteria bacterium]|nr:hypothetical protein [Pseudomonadota bacterium]